MSETKCCLKHKILFVLGGSSGSKRNMLKDMKQMYCILNILPGHDLKTQRILLEDKHIVKPTPRYENKKIIHFSHFASGCYERSQFYVTEMGMKMEIEMKIRGSSSSDMNNLNLIWMN